MHRMMHADLPDDRKLSLTRSKYICPWYFGTFCFLFGLEHQVFGSSDNPLEIDLGNSFGDIFSDIFFVPFLY